MSFGVIVLLLIAVSGHCSLWIRMWNWVESTAMPMQLRSSLARLAKVAFIMLPPMTMSGLSRNRPAPDSSRRSHLRRFCACT